MAGNLYEISEMEQASNKCYNYALIDKVGRHI